MPSPSHQIVELPAADGEILVGQHFAPQMTPQIQEVLCADTPMMLDAAQEAKIPAERKPSEAEMVRSEFEQHLRELEVTFHRLLQKYQHQLTGTSSSPGYQLPALQSLASSWVTQDCEESASGEEFALGTTKQVSHTAGDENLGREANVDKVAGDVTLIDSDRGACLDSTEDTLAERSFRTVSDRMCILDEKLRRTYEAQFRRLDTIGAGRLLASDLLHMLEEHYPDFELADIHAAMLYLNAKSRSPASTGRQSLIRSKTSIVETGIDLEAFMLLRTDTTCEGAAAIVKRDIHHLQKGLEEENNFSLYSDGAVDENRQIDNTPLFNLPVIVIMLNALTIGISLDTGDSVVWEVIEWIYFSLYVLEAVVKIYALGCHWYFRGPSWLWNWFDILCILTTAFDFSLTIYIRLQEHGSPVDLSSMMLIKMLRLARLARLIRTLRYPIFKELKLMVMGVISGMRVLIWAIVLLIVVVYVCGIAATILIGQMAEGRAEFSTLIASMFTLFRCFTDGCTSYDGKPLAEELRREYGVVAVLGYILLFMLVTVGIFNLIMAIFIDNVMESHFNRKQEEISNTAQRIEASIKGCLVRLVINSKAKGGVPDEALDEIRALDDMFSSNLTRIRAQFEVFQELDIVITRSMFTVWLRDLEFLEVLRDADIDVSNKGSLFDVMDADGGGWLSIDELYNGLMKLRGPVSKNDIISILVRAQHLVSQADSLSLSQGLPPRSMSRQTSADR
eukprot:TRINITY_DN6698_c1_g1_i1.p1 TRINITY_DN6698_c1_g1~~TRINITY_DN6698_c1_g1_i1.p1  ORF type:complete len:734 (+),score=134.83 TRINITY_DN6698_c1_g1_i1:133-2334(+)